MRTAARQKVNLQGFSGTELAILAHHLAYAAGRRQREMERLRYDRPGLRRYQVMPENQQKRPAGLQIRQPASPAPAARLVSSRWPRLIREHRFMDHLAQAVAAARAGCGEIDLSKILDNGPGPFLDFLDHELNRARLAVAYVEATPFDPPTRRSLFRILDIELRFFSRLLHQLKGHFPEAGCSHPERISIVPSPNHSSLLRR